MWLMVSCLRGSEGVAVRPFGVPWLLIEMRVLVAVYGDDGGVFLGPRYRN